jgi:hypothetical protein
MAVLGKRLWLRIERIANEPCETGHVGQNFNPTSMEPYPLSLISQTLSSDECVHSKENQGGRELEEVAEGET